MLQSNIVQLWVLIYHQTELTSTVWMDWEAEGAVIDICLYICNNAKQAAYCRPGECYTTINYLSTYPMRVRYLLCLLCAIY